MGFSIRQTARLEFEGDEWVDEKGERLEVEVRLDFTLAQFFELQRALQPITQTVDDPTSVEAEANLDAAIRVFGDRVLVKWNLDVDGVPIEATGEGATNVPLRLISNILGIWSDAVTAHMGVPEGDPLPESSPNGELSLEESATTAA